MSEKRPYDDVEFDWIQLSKDLNPVKEETFLGKWKRKFGDNPFVPVGAFGAVGALSYGLVAMYRGNKMHSQYAMRARVGFQGFAIVALIIGFVVAQEKQMKEKANKIVV